MMKRKPMWVIGFVLFVTPSIVTAGPMSEGSSYAGIQFSQLTYDEDGISNDAEPTALIGRLGYFVADQVAIEGRLGIGLSDDTVRVVEVDPPENVDVELERLLGLYAVGHLPLGDAASFYGLVGFTDAKAKFTGGGGSLSGSDSGLTYGFGADFYTSDDFGINIEYIQYLNETGYDLSALSIGLKFHF